MPQQRRYFEILRDQHLAGDEHAAGEIADLAMHGSVKTAILCRTFLAEQGLLQLMADVADEYRANRENDTPMPIASYGAAACAL